MMVLPQVTSRQAMQVALFQTKFPQVHKSKFLFGSAAATECLSGPTQGSFNLSCCCCNS